MEKDIKKTSLAKKAVKAKKIKKVKKKVKKAKKKSVKKVKKTSAKRDTPNAPTTRDELRKHIRDYFGINVPDRSVCAGHNSPMDYLEASFLDQEDLLIWANRGGGKTFLAAVATLLDAIHHAPLKIRVLGGSFDQSDHLAEYVREMLEERPELLDKRMTRHLVKLKNGSEIGMLAQSQRAVRGQHVQKIRCDEVELFDIEVWQALQFITRSNERLRGSIEVLSTLHRKGGLMERLVSGAEPISLGGQADGDSQAKYSRAGYRLVRWCLWEVIERCPPDRKCTRCPIADDCKGVAKKADGFFRIDDAISIHARSSRSAWETEMLCMGAKRDRLIFREFDRVRHVREIKYRPELDLFRALDFGYTNPMVCLWIQITPAGAVHVLQEYVQSRRAIDMHAQEILERDPGIVRRTYADPAGRQKEATSGAACTEMLAQAGIPCDCRVSNIVEGLELIRAYLAPANPDARALVIHPECKKLIDAFESYHYPDETDALAAKPVKDGPDHLIDALRYFFVNKMRPNAKVKRTRY